MSPETKQEALRKLHVIRNKIGYPDNGGTTRRWRSSRVTTLETSLRTYPFEDARRWDKLGKPVDLNEWGMTPPTVNAYFSPQMNDINFPAGVLPPPLYDPKIDDAPNYGNTGATIGHELTHAFDDEGRQFDRKATCGTGGRRPMQRDLKIASTASATNMRGTSLWTTSTSTPS